MAEGRVAPQKSWISTKTQFAPVVIHVMIIELLRYLKGSGIANLEVIDEGGCWESGDEVTLRDRFDHMTRA